MKQNTTVPKEDFSFIVALTDLYEDENTDKITTKNLRLKTENRPEIESLTRQQIHYRIDKYDEYLNTTKQKSNSTIKKPLIINITKPEELQEIVGKQRIKKLNDQEFVNNIHEQIKNNHTQIKQNQQSILENEKKIQHLQEQQITKEEHETIKYKFNLFVKVIAEETNIKPQKIQEKMKKYDHKNKLQ